MISVAGETLELRGLSTDVKPIETVPNGSIFFEMDTQKVFMLDKPNRRWLELA